MKKILLNSSLLLSLAIAGAAHAADKGPLVIDTITFSDDLSYEKAQQECDLPTTFAKYLGSYLKKQGYKIVDADNASAETPHLNININSLLAPGGGAWSGPKSVRTEGKLAVGEKVLGDFEARRGTTGGVFGGFKGTCSLLNRNVKALSKDISLWAKSPTENAKLGELK